MGHRQRRARGQATLFLLMTQSRLIVTHEVVSEVSDQRQLQPMVEAASRALACPCTVVPNAGYMARQCFVSRQMHVHSLDPMKNAPLARVILGQAAGRLFTPPARAPAICWPKRIWFAGTRAI